MTLQYLLRSLNSSNLLIQRQNRRNRSHRRDTVRIDLAMRLRVMALDVGEIRSRAEGVVVPVEVADPSIRWC
jgi:hypothetical protein